MPKSKVLISSEKVLINGLSVIQWTKVCPVCKKEYKTTSRHQRYCSDACCQKAQKKSRRLKKEYNELAEIHRLSARAHALGVEVMHQLENMGFVEHVCSCCGVVTDNLQVHHKNLIWLDNRPENLQLLCTKCHSAAHSAIDKEIKEGDDAIYARLGQSYPIVSKLLKK